MICFEIFVNGQKLCLAGAEGVLSANTYYWQGNSTDEREPQLHLHVAASSNGERLHWTEPGQIVLKEGDEVTIRVVEAETPDEATHEKRPDKKPEA